MYILQTYLSYGSIPDRKGVRLLASLGFRKCRQRAMTHGDEAPYWLCEMQLPLIHLAGVDHAACCAAG